jgi:hypothetical protein
MRMLRERKEQRSPVRALPTLFICLGVMSAVLVGCPLPQEPRYPDPGVPGLIHFGNHYEDYKDGASDFVYIQLWNFSWIDHRGTPGDASDDYYGVGAYGFTNPDNLMASQGLATTFGMIIRPDGSDIQVNSEPYDPSVPGNFYASPTFAPAPGFEMSNPAGQIDVISADELHIFGDTTDGVNRFVWDLVYTRTPGMGEGWLPWQQWPFPDVLGLWPSWLTYYEHMPCATVNGTFTVYEGTEAPVTYTLVNAKGYADGFYGEQVYSDNLWDWVDYKQINEPGLENLSIHYLNLHGPSYECDGGWTTCEPGNLRVYHNGIEYNFTKHEGEITIEYLDYELDPDYGINYVKQERILASDAAGNVLDVIWTGKQYKRVYYDVPNPFEDNLTYEILSDFEGTFTPAGQAPVTIFGSGFSDWGSLLP